MKDLCAVLFCLAMTSFVVAAQQSFDSTLWLLAPPGVESTLSGGTTEAQLIRRFGRVNVRHENFPGGDGEPELTPGAVLFPEDQEQRIELVWADAERTSLSSARLRGNRSRWQVSPGISLGTTLGDLQRANGRPFLFRGFGFDHDGGVFDWRKGRLSSLEDSGSDGPLISVRLIQGPGSVDGPPTQGDVEVSSDTAGVAAQRIRVWQITARYRRQG